MSHYGIKFQVESAIFSQRTISLQHIIFIAQKKGFKLQIKDFLKRGLPPNPILVPP